LRTSSTFIDEGWWRYCWINTFAKTAKTKTANTPPTRANTPTTRCHHFGFCGAVDFGMGGGSAILISGTLPASRHSLKLAFQTSFLRLSLLSAPPIVFPRSYPQRWQADYLIALGQSLDILLPDRSRTVLLDVRITKTRSD
jgi:hypothetical protein